MQHLRIFFQEIWIPFELSSSPWILSYLQGFVWWPPNPLPEFHLLFGSRAVGDEPEFEMTYQVDPNLKNRPLIQCSSTMTQYDILHMITYVAYCSLNTTCISINTVICQYIMSEYVCIYVRLCEALGKVSFFLNTFADCMTNKQRSETRVNFERSHDNSTKESKAKSLELQPQWYGGKYWEMTHVFHLFPRPWLEKENNKLRSLGIAKHTTGERPQAYVTMNKRQKKARRQSLSHIVKGVF